MDKEIIEIKYSQKLLTEMMMVNGALNKELKKLKKYKLNEPLRYRVFKPIVPENLSKEDLKTIVDLALFSGCRDMILPKNPHIDSLKRRASIYSLNIEETIEEGSNTIRNDDIFICHNCKTTFSFNAINNIKRGVDRYQISSRHHIKGIAYCRLCASKIIEETSYKHYKGQAIIATSLGITPSRCRVAGTCEILKAHHELMKDDPERLTSEFIIGLVCGEEGVKKYKAKKHNRGGLK